MSCLVAGPSSYPRLSTMVATSRRPLLRRSLVSREPRARTLAAVLAGGAPVPSTKKVSRHRWVPVVDHDLYRLARAATAPNPNAQREKSSCVCVNGHGICSTLEMPVCDSICLAFWL